MARRASYFFDVHKTTAPRLLVSGGWEYMRPGGSLPEPEVLRGLAKAYDFMNYDVALLPQEEAMAAKEALVTLDSGRKTAEQAPFTVVVTKDGRKVGFIRFSSLPKGEDMPSQSTIKSITNTVLKERDNVDLLIGLSDWGWLGEREYLAANPEFVPDFLFGSGRGSGVTGRIEADGRCVWFRPYDKGKTVIEVKIYSWPDRTKPFIWQQPENIVTQSIGLSNKFYEHPDVADFFQ